MSIIGFRYDFIPMCHVYNSPFSKRQCERMALA